MGNLLVRVYFQSPQWTQILIVFDKGVHIIDYVGEVIAEHMRGNKDMEMALDLIV